MEITLLSIFGLFIFVTCLILTILVVVFGKSKLQKIWSAFNIGTAIWGFCMFMIGNKSLTEASALLWWKFAHVGAVLMSVPFLHTVMELGNIKKRKILYFLYGVDFIYFIIFNFSNNMGYKMVYLFNSFYYARAININYVIATIIWFYGILYGFFLLGKEFIISKGAKRNQVAYFLFPVFIAFISGSSHFFPAYGVKVYPFNIFMIVYPIFVSYAILKYRLMDIRVAITRTGIFVAVYTLILGFPFAVAGYFKPYLIDSIGPHWWMVPLGLMSVLATVGPFIYIYLDKRAEAALFREQRRYQDTLKQASMGMVRIRDLRRLLELIAHIVTRTVHINYISIYIHDQITDQYVLHVSRDKGRVPLATLPPDDPLIAWISLKREPLIAEEVRRQYQDTKDETYRNIEESMQKLFASVVIPSYLEDKFIGFICLGDKQSGAIYTADDLNVFQVLASQAALAIENAQFYDEAKEMQEQISQAEKMATIGTMADGLSHQINNRFYALGLIAGDTIDTIKITDTTQCSPEIKTMIAEISKALDRIQVNVTQGGQVVQGMLKYSRRGSEGFEALDLAKILDNTLEMVQFKVKLSEIDIVRDFDSAPKIKGNMTQLEEVFFNFIDNANDAIFERKHTLKEEGYRGKITFSCRPKDENTVEIIVEDNGIGVKEDDAKKIFTPFFTTKTSAHVANKKGTGLGLYVIRRIINDMHRGRITFESQYRTGTRFILQLPAAK